ncbi:MAG: sigma-54 dependent transcriptional regulator [Dysgonamonadaceae bacterium]|jgi:two-component system response regulator HydG|nr:sigma-54 dependent transcriptional regulator [Dysgonamonadaceae bacterium]
MYDKYTTFGNTAFINNILIIDDDITLSLMLKTWLAKKGFNVNTAIKISDAKKEIVKCKPELIISDLRLPDENGISFLKWTKERYPEIIFIMMTGYADIQTAVESIRSGAYDYIAKPLNPDELLIKIHSIAPSKEDNNFPPANVAGKTKKSFSDYIQGNSPEYKKVYEHVDMVASTDLSVFIRGDSGVGKEHIARMIHHKSKRATGPFIPVDCGTMSRELSASEFFGHLRGSFTGAINNKKGYFLEANGGTLFLDEIGNLSPDIQMQLLRVLQEKKIKPVGASKEIKVDVRIITATNEDLDVTASKGKFRSDLYHRINEFLIAVPSLKECKDDIPLFAHHFLGRANLELNENVTGFDEDALKFLIAYRWPGNLRELKNVIFRMTLITKKNKITSAALLENIPEIARPPKGDKK